MFVRTCRSAWISASNQQVFLVFKGYLEFCGTWVNTNECSFFFILKWIANTIHIPNADQLWVRVSVWCRLLKWTVVNALHRVEEQWTPIRHFSFLYALFASRFEWAFSNAHFILVKYRALINALELPSRQRNLLLFTRLHTVAMNINELAKTHLSGFVCNASSWAISRRALTIRSAFQGRTLINTRLIWIEPVTGAWLILRIATLSFAILKHKWRTVDT